MRVNVKFPRDDIDEEVVRRLIIGRAVASNIAERIEVTRLLTEKGLTARPIARQLGVTVRSVERYRAELRAT